MMTSETAVNHGYTNEKFSTSIMSGVHTSPASPIVVIGTGPVGINLLHRLFEQAPQAKYVIYGNEPWEPYQRNQLTTFLAGNVDWNGLVENLKLPVSGNIIQRYNCSIVEINRDEKYVRDVTGHIQPYAKLIIATGSRPHIPHIRGIHLQGVYNFRNLSDVQQLIARRVRSRRTIILGGGVLGLEAARAMSREHTQVFIVDHAHWLMSSQLDEAAAETLKEHILSLNIRIFLKSSVKEILGKDTVTGVILRNGIQINCDTIVIAAGIRPNTEVARKAGLRIGRGIHVNDNMQTSDENIYAIGECAEHRGIVYGLISPGHEQAKVAANCVLGRETYYQGSISATRLNVIGIDVFSMGHVNDLEPGSLFSHRVYYAPSKGIYRKIIVKRGRLVGTIAIGTWKQVDRIKQGVLSKRFLWPLQLKRFESGGDIWSK